VVNYDDPNERMSRINIEKHAPRERTAHADPDGKPPAGCDRSSGDVSNAVSW
jgi:hypothetical protein